MPIPVPVLIGFVGFILIFTLLALIFSFAASKGIVFHGCGGGGDFYCTTCPSQLGCPATELQEKIIAQKEV
ncbi:MAG: hypothetical protein ACRC9L_01985 [Brevinema sp.]